MNKSEIVNDIFSDQVIFLDGAMGTMLQKSGLKLGERPEILCITEPDVIEDIHRKYIDSGSNIVYANTFGANAHKLEGTGYEAGEIITAAVKIAKKAVSDVYKRQVYCRDSAQIVTPFVRVGTYPTRNFATLGPL